MASFAYVCNVAGNQYVLGSSDAAGTCPVGSGAWVEQAEPFDVAAWLATPEGKLAFGKPFCASFVIVGMFFVVGKGVQSLLSLLK